MNKNIKLIILIILVSIKFCSADGLVSGYTLLKDLSARPAMLGGGGAVLKDVGFVIYNPALTTALTDKQLSVVYQAGFAKEEGIGSFIFGMPRFCAGLFYYNLGDLEFYNTRDELRKVNAQTDILGIMSFGFDIIEKIGCGVGVKFLQSELVEYKKAISYMLDLGVLVDGRLAVFGVSLQNIGKKLRYIEEKENLPTLLRLSVSCRPLVKEALLAADCIYLIFDKNFISSFGVEYEVFNNLILRAGHKFGSDVEGLRLGFGLRVENFSIDYTYGLAYALDSQHFFSFTVNF